MTAYLNKYSGISAILILVVLICAVYYNSVEGSYQIDDQVHIVLNKNIDNPGYYLTKENLSRLANGRMLSFLTYTMNYKVGGLNLTGFHLFNIFLHILNVILVLKLAKKIILLSGEKFNNIQYIPFFTALVFALHPVQTEAVTYITQRMVSLSAFFYLSAILIFIKAREWHIDHKLFKCLLMYGLVFVCFIFGIWSKENALSLPLMLLLIEIFFIRIKRKHDKVFLTSFIILIAGAFLYKVLSGIPLVKEANPAAVYWLTELKILLMYIRICFIPINQQFFYDITEINNLFSTQALIALLCNLLLLATAIILYKKNKLISFGVFWFYTAHSVEAFVPLKYFINEYRLYLPLFGYSLILVTLVTYFCRDKKRYYTGLVLMMLYISYLGIATILRNELWKDPILLWGDNLQKAPELPVVNLNYGYYLLNSGKPKIAAEYFNKAIELDPLYTEAYVYRGVAASELANYQNALEYFNKAISIDTTCYMAYYNKAATFYKLKLFSDAVRIFQKASMYTTNYKTYFSMGDSYYQQSKLDSAIICYTTSINLNPEHYESYYHRGLAYYYKKRNYEEALNDLLIAHDSMENIYEGLNYIGICYRELGKIDSALYYHNSALNYKTDFLFGIMSRAKTLETAGKYDLAIADLSSILKYNPTNTAVLKYKSELENRLSKYLLTRNN